MKRNSILGTSELDRDVSTAFWADFLVVEPPATEEGLGSQPWRPSASRPQESNPQQHRCSIIPSVTRSLPQIDVPRLDSRVMHGASNTSLMVYGKPFHQPQYTTRTIRLFQQVIPRKYAATRRRIKGAHSFNVSQSDDACSSQDG